MPGLIKLSSHVTCRINLNLELVVVSKASVKYIAIGFILLHGLAVLAHVTDYYLQLIHSEKPCESLLWV